MVPPKFREWVRKQVFSKRSEGECTHITVRHLSAGKNAMGDVERVNVPRIKEIQDGEADDTIGLLSLQLWEAAQGDADGLVGVQSYAFLSFFDEAPDKHVSRYSARFTSTAEEEGSEDPSASEPATKSGLLSQTMRHLESMARMATQGSMHQLSLQQRTIQSQQDIIEKMTKDRMDTFRLMEDLHSKKHERDMEMKERERSIQLQDELIERLTPYIPVLASKLTGSKLLPAKGQASADGGVRELLTSLTPEQMEAAQQILRPEQMTLLVSMMMEAQKEDEAKTASTNGAQH